MKSIFEKFLSCTRYKFDIFWKLILIIVLLQIYSYYTYIEDIVDEIHTRNLKAVQIFNDRFTYKNWGLSKLGEEPFKNCKEKRCYAFKAHKYLQKPVEKSDGIMVHIPNLHYLHFLRNYKRRREQLWLFYTLESQRRSYCSLFYNIEDLDDLFNLTVTFKHESDFVMDYHSFSDWKSLVYTPNYVSLLTNLTTNYEKLAQLYRNVKPIENKPFIFWFVSNCFTPSRREDYIKELIKYVQVDIYGTCENKFEFSKLDPCKGSFNNELCTKDLYNSYKFYLAFENGQCNEYITEKFWKLYNPNHLFDVHVIPIVRGAKEEHYRKRMPLEHKSFINADSFKNPKELANYLKYLNENTTAFLEYFEWKTDLLDYEKNKNQSINSTKTEMKDDSSPFCEICAKLYNQTYLKTNNKIVRISEWFNPEIDCWDRGEKNLFFVWVAKAFGYCV